MKRGLWKGLALVMVLGIAVIGGFAGNAIAGDYTDKSYHSSDGTHIYKHPKQRSFTSPFDYGPRAEVAPAPAPQPTGKCNCFTFDATKSHDVDGQKLTVWWDFGDGTTSDQAIVQHCYDKAGDFNVTLTVKDNSGMVCDTGVNSVRVSPNYPPVVDAGDDAKICLGETVSFDASRTQISGSPKYIWNFGDGETAEGMRVTHTYQKPGTYRVLLSADDGKGTECSTGQDTLTVWVMDRVTISSVEGPSSACTGQTVSFTANGSGGGKYTWDFGDGTTWSGGPAASHSYQKGGKYNVTVTADNGQGSACSTATSGTSIMINSRPIADAGDNVMACVGATAVFDASGSSDPEGDALSYHWDFGDGTTGEGVKVNHAYDKIGNYRVTLTVKDSSGGDCGVSGDSVSATVNAKPEAVIGVR